jgi:hypothetical protein
MKYPAYVSVEPKSVLQDDQFQIEHPWLGYRYCSDPVLNTFVAPCAGENSKFIQKYADISACNERMKRALTDMANNIARKAWNESSGSDSRGRLCFYVGGINSISPFSSYAVENELVVFADLALDGWLMLEANECNAYDEDGQPCKYPYDMYVQI